MVTCHMPMMKTGRNETKNIIRNTVKKSVNEKKQNIVIGKQKFVLADSNLLIGIKRKMQNENAHDTRIYELKCCLHMVANVDVAEKQSHYFSNLIILIMMARKNAKKSVGDQRQCMDGQKKPTGPTLSSFFVQTVIKGKKEVVEYVLTN